MGLLDDAIRQHLDLKRRHGADPSDVAKLEHEALGPVEREDALAVPDLEEPTSAGDHIGDAGVAHEEEVAYEEAEAEAEERWAETHPEAEETTSQLEPVAPARGGSVRLEEADDPAREIAEPEEEPVPGEHDELEETPEFLEETPEHDRLWFEQKPPRDFDF